MSDPDSEIIGRLGILNTLVDPDDHPWYGIPFPGTYVLDADGVIFAKFFEERLGVRANASEILAAAQGELVELASADAPSDGEVVATVRYDGDHLGAIVHRDLIVELAIPEGQHVYADPAPQGMVAVSIELDESDRVGVTGTRSPATHDHHLDGTDEVFPVHDGTVQIRQSLVFLPEGPGEEKVDIVTVAGTVRWQACDALACRIPQSQRFEFELPIVRGNWPFGETADGRAAMDFQHHFAKMASRRQPGGG